MSAPQSARYEQPSLHRGGETSPLTTGKLKHLRGDEDREYDKRTRHRAASGRVDDQQYSGPLSPINRANREATPLYTLDIPQLPLVEDDLSLAEMSGPVDTGDMHDQFDFDSFLSEERQSELSFVHDTNSNYYAGTENMEKEAVSSTGKTGTLNVEYNRPDVQSQELLHSVIPAKRRWGPRKAEYKQPDVTLSRLNTGEMQIQSPSQSGLQLPSQHPLQQTQSAQQQYQQASSPSIYFHHSILPTSQKDPQIPSTKSQHDSLYTQNAASHLRTEYASSPKKRKTNPIQSQDLLHSVIPARKRGELSKVEQDRRAVDALYKEKQIRGMETDNRRAAPSQDDSIQFATAFSDANAKAGSASLSFDPSGGVGSDGHNVGMQVQDWAYQPEGGRQSRLAEVETDQISGALSSTSAELYRPTQVESADHVLGVERPIFTATRIHEAMPNGSVGRRPSTQMGGVMNAPILYSGYHSSSSSVVSYETVEKGAIPLRLQEIDATEEERRRAKEEIFKMLKQWTTCDLSRWTNEGMEYVKADMKGAEGISAIS